MTSEDFAARVTAMTGTLYRVCSTVLSREADREDAVQEAVCRAWEKRDSLKNPGFFQTWMIRILLNACYDTLRSQKRVVYMDRLPEPETGPEEIPEEAIALRKAVSSLEESLRLPVVLYYAEGFPVEQIARALGLTRGAVKQRLYRARALLKEQLTEEDFT